MGTGKGKNPQVVPALVTKTQNPIRTNSCAVGLNADTALYHGFQKHVRVLWRRWETRHLVDEMDKQLSPAWLCAVGADQTQPPWLWELSCVWQPTPETECPPLKQTHAVWEASLRQLRRKDL